MRMSCLTKLLLPKERLFCFSLHDCISTDAIANHSECAITFVSDPSWVETLALPRSTAAAPSTRATPTAAAFGPGL